MDQGVIRSQLLARQEMVNHGFFGRRGGVSEGHYASLNGSLLVGDDPDAVVENRGRMLRVLSLPKRRLLTLRQVHSARVETVTADDSRPVGGIEADALVARDPSLVLGIATADCAPVLFVDATSGVDRKSVV